MAFALPGIGLAALALASLVPTVRAIAAHASSIAFSPRDMIGLPLALSFFALAAMTLPPSPLPGSGPKKRPATAPNRTASICLWIAVAGALAAVVASPVSQAAIELFVGRDYRRCPAHDDGSRHAPLRWTLPLTPC